MIIRNKKPIPESEISFSLPEVKEATLPNGLKLVYIRKQNLPITRINLVIDSGSKYDPANKKGLSNLTSMVIDEGADGMSALQISDTLDMLGSSFSVSSDNDSTGFKLQTLTENLEESLNIFSKVLLKPDFIQKEFDRQRRKILTRLLQLSDEPEYVAQQIFEHLALGPDNPNGYPSLGYDKDIQSIFSEDIRKFYTANYLPENSFIAGVGDKDFDSFNQMLNKYIGTWDRHPNNRKIYFSNNNESGKIFLHDKNDSVQSEIRVGHHTPARNYYSYFPRLILNTILGGQFTSRINLNLRESKGYTYGAFSSFNFFKDSAYFYVSTSVGSENTKDALIEIYGELDRIRQGITGDELEFAKSSIIKKFPLNFETYRQINGNLVTKMLHSLPDDFFNTYIEKVKSVTASEVNKAARDLIHPDKAIAVVVGDKKSLGNSLNSLKMNVISVNSLGEPIE